MNKASSRTTATSSKVRRSDFLSRQHLLQSILSFNNHRFVQSTKPITMWAHLITDKLNSLYLNNDSNFYVKMSRQAIIQSN